MGKGLIKWVSIALICSVINAQESHKLTLKQIAKIQPGLGTIMMEFGHRFYIVYYAAKAKNWDLAKYELHELIEAQEVAEVTRPKYKKDLKAFEDTFLNPLNETIKNKNFDKFSKLYNKSLNGCNACHIKNAHPYIKYKLPKKPPKFLDL
jgi:hypothetical protein